ncbi:MAG: hypothetical protein O7D98_07145 [Candidatus Dadabacteria bacterium]|jgi:hypothetical protein|nr:hypothetical protein [Candidatus Dadabacteria bacterium]
MKLSGKSTSSGQLTIKSRAYFSAYHFKAAKHFLDLATEIEDQDGPIFNINHRAYIHNSVLSSVAFLEAAINELFQDAYDEHQIYINSLAPTVIQELATYWANTEMKGKHKPTLVKYKQALIISDSEKMIEDENPYEDTRLLIELRNFLTHYKPKSVGGDSSHKIEDILKGKFGLNKKYEKSGNPDFPDKMLGKECAKWGLTSVENFADEFFRRIDIQPNYQKVDFD